MAGLACAGVLGTTAYLKTEEASPCRRGSFRHSTESSVPRSWLVSRSRSALGAATRGMSVADGAPAGVNRCCRDCQRVACTTERCKEAGRTPHRYPRDSAQVLGRAGRDETVTSLFCADRRSWGDRPPRPSPCFVTDRGRISVRYPCCRTKLVRPVFTGAVALCARGGELLHSGPRDESMSGLCALHKPETGCNRGLSQ